MIIDSDDPVQIWLEYVEFGWDNRPCRIKHPLTAPQMLPFTLEAMDKPSTSPLDHQTIIMGQVSQRSRIDALNCLHPASKFQTFVPSAPNKNAMGLALIGTSSKRTCQT